MRHTSLGIEVRNVVINSLNPLVTTSAAPSSSISKSKPTLQFVRVPVAFMIPLYILIKFLANAVGVVKGGFHPVAPGLAGPGVSLAPPNDIYIHVLDDYHPFLMPHSIFLLSHLI